MKIISISTDTVAMTYGEITMLTLQDRLYFTKTELEYIDTDNLDSEETNMIDNAIDILSKALKEEEHVFTEEETEKLQNAIDIQTREMLKEAQQ